MASLVVGAAAPDFEAEDLEGQKVTLKELRGQPAVLFFYPKDETPGCVAEACAFRDEWDDFKAIDVPVFGISRDSPSSHRRFAENRRLPYGLLSDRDGSMHRAYGALALGVLPRRVSYLLDAEGRIAAVHEARLKPSTHAAAMLEAARGLAPRP